MVAIDDSARGKVNERHHGCWRIAFGLRIASDIAGEEVAQAIQLGLEYHPNPPFNCGHPDRASSTVSSMMAPRYEHARVNFCAALAS